MTAYTAPPITNGTQPPASTFNVFAEKKPTSITANTPATSNETHKLHCQISLMAMNSRSVVTNIVNDTAIPNAAANDSDVLKFTVRMHRAWYLGLGALLLR